MTSVGGPLIGCAAAMAVIFGRRKTERGPKMAVADEVLAYLRALVWPCVAVIALILFRRQLAALIPRIREVSAADASVKFGEQATELADEAGRLV